MERKHKQLCDVSREALIELREVLIGMYPPTLPSCTMLETESGRMAYAKLRAMYDLVEAIDYELKQTPQSRRLA